MFTYNRAIEIKLCQYNVVETSLEHKEFDILYRYY